MIKIPQRYIGFKEDQTLAENNGQSNLSSSKNSLRETMGSPLLWLQNEMETVLEESCALPQSSLSLQPPPSTREELEGSPSPGVGWQPCA